MGVWSCRFTILTLGTVETVRTLTSILPNTRTSIQAHGRAESWRRTDEIVSIQRSKTPKHSWMMKSRPHSPVSQDGPVQPGGHKHSSGDTHWPPLWQWRLHTTAVHKKQYSSRSWRKQSHFLPVNVEKKGEMWTHWSHIEVRQTRKDKNKSGVQHKCLHFHTVTCTELQRYISVSSTSVIVDSLAIIVIKHLIFLKTSDWINWDKGGELYLPGRFLRENLWDTDTHPEQCNHRRSYNLVHRLLRKKRKTNEYIEKDNDWKN